VTAPDPAAVLADDAVVEELRTGRVPKNSERLVAMLAAWRASIDAGES
jgi:hypothetical protein